MPKHDTKQSTKERFHLHRVRKGLYHVTDTTNHVEYQTSEPLPFRPSKQVIVEATPKKDVDMHQLAELLLRILEDSELGSK